MKFTYLIIGNSYISINLANKYKSLNLDYIKVNDPFDLKKLKLNKRKKYIVIYLFIRLSKNIIYNKNKLKFTSKFFLKFAHKFIYVSTAEFEVPSIRTKIHKSNENFLGGKNNDILRIVQIYGGKLINKKKEYGINGFLESLKSDNLIIIKKDYRNIRSYCSLDEFFKALEYLANKKYVNKYLLINKKKISFINVAKKIIEFSKKRNSSILIDQNTNVQYRKSLIYGNFKKISFNCNFEKKLKKVVNNYFSLF